MLNENQNQNLTINITDIVKNGNMAKFVYAIAGVLYYEVNSPDEHVYLFPIDMNDKDDVGTATFPCEMKAITIMRYIRKALQNNSVIILK